MSKKRVEYLFQKAEVNLLRKENYGKKISATVECSQCKSKMRKSTADIQIENKRENAPICPSCICGYKRKIK